MKVDMILVRPEPQRLGELSTELGEDWNSMDFACKARVYELALLEQQVSALSVLAQVVNGVQQ